MRKLYSEHDLKEIMGTVSIQNEVIDTRIAETLDSIRQGKSEDMKQEKKERSASEEREHLQKKQTVWKKAICGIGAAAAMFFVALSVFVANPSLAADIPILEDIFTKVQNVFSFGAVPENEAVKLYEEETGAEQDGDLIYQAKYHGITITFTEYYASNQAIFYGVCIESKEPFPEFAAMGGTGPQLMLVNTEEKYSFRDDTIINTREIEGKQQDAHTFVGVMRIDYDTITEYYVIPEEFEVKMKIDSLKGYCKEMIDEETGTVYKVRGNWDIPLCKIKKSDKDVRTIQLDEINGQGIGLEKIEISPVEMTLYTVEPADHLTYAVVLDKNGKRLKEGSSNIYELAVAGHDISTVTVYICDYDEYMDFKSYAYEDEEKFYRLLEERALFKKVVDTEK